MSRWEQNVIAGDVAGFGYPNPEQWGAFLLAICAAPDNDAVRLIAADWLDEQGFGLRAELIRVQCALANEPVTSPRHNDRRYCVAEPWETLRRREQDLLLAVVPVWLPACKGRWVWRRGFIEGATLTAADWCQHADALLAANPIRDVTLTTWPVGDGAPKGRPRNCPPEATQALLQLQLHRYWPSPPSLKMVLEMVYAGIHFTPPSEGVSFLHTLRESL